MKVTNDTKELLVIDDRPWVFSMMTMGLAVVFTVAAYKIVVIEGNLMGLFILFGAVLALCFFAFITRRTQLVLHGPEGWAEVRTRSFRGYSAIRHKISEIERAIVETQRMDDTDTHRVTLIIPQGQSKGRHALTQVYTSGDSTKRAVAAINRWLDSHRAQA